MKKFAKITAIAMVVVLSVVLLASCGVSQKTADKINEAFKNGEPMSVADVKKLCGDPTADLTIAGSGLLTFVNGCKTIEEANQKRKDGKSVKALYVTCVAGKATGAIFQDYDPDKKS